MLDLMTPKDAAQAVLMAALLTCYAGISKLVSASLAKKKAYALKTELNGLEKKLLDRLDGIENKFDSFMRQRFLEPLVGRFPVVESGTLKVLLIEDDRKDRYLMHRAAPSIQFDDAPTLEDGLRMLARNGYDCVILDIGLPGQQELEALKAVRAQDPSKPIVIWTGNDSPKFPIEAARIGVEGWLFKRAHLDEATVVRAVKEAILRKNV